MSFTFTNTPLNGVVIIESKVFTDSRGYFMESFKLSDFRKYFPTFYYLIVDSSKHFRFDS